MTTLFFLVGLTVLLVALPYVAGPARVWPNLRPYALCIEIIRYGFACNRELARPKCALTMALG